MVAYLKDLGVGILFAIGGDGTLRGAQKIGEEAARQGLEHQRHRHPEDHRQRRLVRAADIWIRDRRDRGAARDVRRERRGGSRTNGIGLVKLMGRDSGSSPPIRCWSTAR